MAKKKLLKISTYAAKKGISRQAVYQKINKNQLKTKTIDGVKFVVINS